MKILKHLLNKFKEIKAILKLGWLFYNGDYYEEEEYADIVTILSRENR